MSKPRVSAEGGGGGVEQRRTRTHVAGDMLRAGEGGLADWTFVVASHSGWQSELFAKEYPVHTKRRHCPTPLDNE